MPGTEFHIVMIGNEIAPKLHNKAIRHENRHNGAVMTLSVFLGYYHNYYGAAADLAIGEP